MCNQETPAEKKRRRELEEANRQRLNRSSSRLNGNEGGGAEREMGESDSTTR
jgi:hypothetical protein